MENNSRDSSKRMQATDEHVVAFAKMAARVVLGKTMDDSVEGGLDF